MANLEPPFDSTVPQPATDPAANESAALDILCEDGPLLAVNKPAGLLTQGVPDGIPTLEAQVRVYLKLRYSKPGNVYLGIPHRLDRPVSGVVVFARNSKAAARLAEQFRERTVRKLYWGIVESPPDPPQGELIDWVLKIPDEARVEIVAPETPAARECRLSYRTLAFPTHGDASGGAGDAAGDAELSRRPQYTLLEIELHTGRMHQIRVQFASRGSPIVGDFQYGALTALLETRPADPHLEPIALHARSLTLKHPVRYDSLVITAPIPRAWERFDLPDELLL